MNKISERTLSAESVVSERRISGIQRSGHCRSWRVGRYDRWDTVECSSLLPKKNTSVTHLGAVAKLVPSSGRKELVISGGVGSAGVGEPEYMLWRHSVQLLDQDKHSKYSPGSSCGGDLETSPLRW